jgi:hypothetical protein
MYTAADPHTHTHTPRHGVTTLTQNKSQSNRSTWILKARQMHKKHAHAARRHTGTRSAPAFKPNARTQIVWKVRKKFQKKKTVACAPTM